MTNLEGLKWVRLVFVDVFGAAHAVVLPADRFVTAVEKGAPFDGSALAGRVRHFEEDMLLRPDLATMVDLGEGQGRVACSVTGPNGLPWLGDPRTALVRLLDDLGDRASTYMAAAELEFYVLRPDGGPVDRGGYYGQLDGPGMAVARGAAERLADFAVPAIRAHLESGPGQYELDLASMTPLALADALVLTKEVLRDEATRAGLRVTFMARPFSGQPGSGLHLQQHLEPAGSPVAGPATPVRATSAAGSGGGLFDEKGGLTPTGLAFVAGQLVHAPGLTALAAPNVNSYKRLNGGFEAPSDVMWGHLNRSALVRVGSSGEQRPAVEFRLADPAANPYLLVGGLLAAAVHGMNEDLDPGAPFEEDIRGYDPATATAIQVRTLPRDLDSALDALLADDVLVDAFDSRLLSPLVDGRRAEADRFRGQVTPWEVDHYLDEA